MSGEAATVEQTWNEAERAAWLPLENLPPHEWAEKHRYLTRQQTSRPGPWRNDQAPYLVGIMLICVMRGIVEITIIKGSQMGVSEGLRCVVGRWAHLEPDAILYVLPDEKTGKAIVHDRLIPLFTDTPVLAELSTGRRWDKKNDQINLSNGFVLRLGYSGSIASVAAHPAKRVICDERSKFQTDGKVSIGDSIEARTATFEDAKVINVSTPGADPDPTTVLFEKSQIKLFFYISCPHCGREQQIIWDRIEWQPKQKDEPDKAKRATAIVADKSAWLNCENPKCAIDHPAGCGRITDQHKRACVQAGFWGTDDFAYKLFCDGREEGTFPRGSRVGLFAPALISLGPGHTFFKCAERFTNAEGDIEALTGFHNEVLAKVFQDSISPVTTSVFAAKCRPNPELSFVPPRAKVVPKWASRLLMTVDTQKDHFWFVIRAWGHGWRSRRIAHGRALTFGELDEWFYRTRFPYEDNAYEALGCYMMGIDSGGGIRRTDEYGVDASRTNDVYQYCTRDPAWLKPLKGEGRRPLDQPQRLRRVTYSPPGKSKDPYTVWLHFFDSGHYEDILASYIAQEIPVVDFETGEIKPDEVDDLWELNDDNDEVYNRHLSNVHKVWLREKGKTTVARHVPRTPGARHDLRDDEVMQIMLAHGPARCGMLPTPDQMAEQLSLTKEAAMAGRQVAGINMPDGRPFLATKR